MSSPGNLPNTVEVTILVQNDPEFAVLYKELQKYWLVGFLTQCANLGRYEFPKYARLAVTFFQSYAKSKKLSSCYIVKQIYRK